MTRITTILVLAGLLALPVGTPLFAADASREAVDQFEDAMKDADEAGKIALIEGLAKSQPENESASKAISKYVGDRSIAVRVAALKALGAYKDKKYLGTFLSLLKTAEDQPAVMEAALLGIAELGDRRAKKDVIDVAKKFLPRNAAVASAAATALGTMPDRESVDELIKLLDLTYPRQSKEGPSVSQETRKILEQSRGDIMKALVNLTGYDFGEPRIWQLFWDRNNKSWKPGRKEVDLATLEKYEDPGYGFRIEKPSDKWTMSKAPGCRIVMDLKGEELTYAQVAVQAYDMSAYTSSTAEGKASEREAMFRQEWADIKDDKFDTSKYRVGRVEGVLQSFRGLNPTKMSLRQKVLYVTNDNIMYVVTTWVRSGAEQSVSTVDEDVDKIIASFQLTATK